MPNLGGWELVILIVVVLLLFGAKKLPDMARSVGQSARIFKGEMKGMKDDEAAGAQARPPAAQTPPAPLPPAQPTQAAPSTPAAGSQDTAQPAEPVKGERQQ